MNHIYKKFYHSTDIMLEKFYETNEISVDDIGTHQQILKNTYCA